MQLEPQVNFHNFSDAETALDTLSYTNIHGRSCRLMWSYSSANQSNPRILLPRFSLAAERRPARYWI